MLNLVTNHSVLLQLKGNQPVPLLIDLDVGVDDAGALILASAHKELVHIVALTTVEGNTDEGNAYKNTKYLLKKLGKNYPI